MPRATTAKPKPAPPTPRPIAPPIDPDRVAALAVQVLAGAVVTTRSLEEFGALLAVLKQRGYALKRRTEWEVNANPFLFIVEEPHAQTHAL
jgi:hypothetical protein